MNINFIQIMKIKSKRLDTIINLLEKIIIPKSILIEVLKDAYQQYIKKKSNKLKRYIHLLNFAINTSTPIDIKKMNKINTLDHIYLRQNKSFKEDLPIVDPTILEYNTVICTINYCYIVINGNWRVWTRELTRKPKILDYNFLYEIYGKDIITKYYKAKSKQ